MGPGGHITVTDDLGDDLVLGAPPARIVSLVPSITETLIDLGVGERLVGITNYCVHPRPVVDGIAKVGGTKGISFEKIGALAPDLILANKEENRKQHIDRLRKTYPVFVTYPRTVEGAIRMVIDLGRLIGCEERAAEIASECSQLLEDAPPSVVGPPLRTACMIWRDPWMAAGSDNYMSELLATVGLVNVFDTADGRYPETTLDAVIERAGEVVLLPDEPFEFGAADRAEIESYLAEKKHDARVLLVDGSYLTWFGSRTARGLGYLQAVKAELLAKRDSFQ